MERRIGDVTLTYPRAALAIVEDAGHALIHERPELLGALLADWVGRMQAAEKRGPSGVVVSVAV